MAARAEGAGVGVYLKELRAPFFTAAIVPVLIGTAIAWARSGEIHWVYFLATLAAGVCLHAGTNVANDYFDHASGADEANRDFVRPFSGGSRLIQEGLLAPRQVLAFSLALFAAGAAIGLYLIASRGPELLALGAFGMLSGYFYTAPPLRLAHRGVGEILVGLNFGTLLTLAAYFAQTRAFALEPALVSLVPAILIALVLTVNGFPDHDGDAAVGKRTLVVRLGKPRAARFYAAGIALTYALLAGLALLGLASPWILLGWATAPIAVKAVRTALAHHSDTRKLVPANAATVLLHLSIGLLVTAGYVVQGFLAKR